MLLYFFWPEDGKYSSKKKREACQKMNHLLFRDPDVKDAFTQIDCYKVNLKTLDSNLKKRYRIKTAPTLVFIDATGKVLKRTTSSKMSSGSMLRLIKTVLKASARNVKKFNKKLETEEKKKPQTAKKD